MRIVDVAKELLTVMVVLLHGSGTIQIASQRVDIMDTQAEVILIAMQEQTDLRQQLRELVEVMRVTDFAGIVDDAGKIENSGEAIGCLLTLRG